MTRRTIDPTKRQMPPRRRGKALEDAKAAEAAKKAEIPPYYLPGNAEGMMPTRVDDVACEILYWWRPEAGLLWRGHKDVVGYMYGKTERELRDTWKIMNERRKFAGKYFEKNGRIDPSANLDEHDADVRRRAEAQERLYEVQRSHSRKQERAAEAAERRQRDALAETRWIDTAIRGGRVPPIPGPGQLIDVRHHNGAVQAYVNANDFDWTLMPGEPGTVAAWRPLE